MTLVMTNDSDTNPIGLLTNKIVFITRASRGIGAAAARLFAREGARFGISRADYRVLAHLSEAPDARLRSSALTQLLRWEKSRLSQHLGRMETRDS